MRQSLIALFLAVTASFIVACSKPADSDSGDAGATANVAAVDPSMKAALDGAKVLAKGSFSGRNDHVVTGGVTVLDLEGRIYLRLDGEFTLDGAPDPKIGFGRSGEYDTATTFTDLGSHGGSQDYVLPEGFDLGTLNEAYIWCDKFSVALGVASLEQ